MGLQAFRERRPRAVNTLPIWEVISLSMTIPRAVLIPFLGTGLGAACVFGMRGRMTGGLRRALSGFAAGVMAAASVWSLLLPAMEQSAAMGAWAFLPAAAGYWAGAAFLMACERLLPWLSAAGERSEAMLALAVTIHNLPEGMAVGVACAALAQGGAGVTAAGVLSLALGIAIQNVPEGAIISMPLRAGGAGKGRAFLAGALSGAIEPVGALMTLWLSGLLAPMMPAFLGFAAGAMLHVVAWELLPEAGEGAPTGAALFSLGFTLMMALDVALSA